MVAHVSTVASGIVYPHNKKGHGLIVCNHNSQNSSLLQTGYRGTISHRKLVTDFIMPELSHEMGVSVLPRSLALSAPSFVLWDPRRKHRASTPKMAILKKINITSNMHLFHSWAFFPFSWQKGGLLCYIPAQMGFLTTKLNRFSCYALSAAQTHSLAIAIPAPGALPAESLALLLSLSYLSQKSSPHCCDCSLCFCSPLVLLVEAEAGPLQVHRAFLRTSSQRHPTKRGKNWLQKDPQPQRPHSGLLNTPDTPPWVRVLLHCTRCCTSK